MRHRHATTSPTPRARSRSRSALITIDLRGLLFSLQIVTALALLGAILYYAVPVVRSAVADGSITLAAVGTAESSGTSDEWALPTDNAGDTSVVPARSEDLVALLGAVPNTGRFVRVDVAAKEITLYEDGARVSTYPVLQVPPVGTPDEVPEGRYAVVDKTQLKLSTLTLVRFPHYVRFADRYAIHGEPTDASGAVRTENPMEGSIIVAQNDAEAIYAFVTEQTPVFVYTGAVVDRANDQGSVTVDADHALPATTARSYLVADLETGQVYLEKEGDAMFPIASITKFVTAAVASALIPHTDEVVAPNGEKYTVGDLQYLLLLRSDNGVADAFAEHVGTESFMAHMQTYVQSLGMQHTSFKDPSGLSPKNISSSRDLALLAKHLYEKQPFILDISSEESMTITSSGGMRLALENQNQLAWDPHFRGGKLGFTDEALQTSLAIFSLPVEGTVRPVVVVILGSNDWKQDTRTLLRWLLEGTKEREQ